MTNNERANPEKEKVITTRMSSSLDCQGPNNRRTAAHDDLLAVTATGMAAVSIGGLGFSVWGSIADQLVGRQLLMRRPPSADPRCKRQKQRAVVLVAVKKLRYAD